MIDPQAQSFLDQLAAENPPTWRELGPETSRRVFKGLGQAVFGAPVEVAGSRDLTFGDVPVRVYLPAGAGPFGAVAYFHGGGWVVGDLDTHDAVCRRLCRGSGMTVMAVDYRLAPEHRFPTALEDCYHATLHWVEHAEEYSLDANRLIVAGDSAGGNLAAAVAIQARDRGGPRIRGQALLYPVIEPLFDSGSYVRCAEGHGLTRDSMEWFWDCYLSSDADKTSPLAVPSGADLRGLPPALVLTAEYDVLCDEGRKYAQALTAAGVPVNYLHVDGMIHGFLHMQGMLDRGRETLDELARRLRAM